MMRVGEVMELVLIRSRVAKEQCPGRHLTATATKGLVESRHVGETGQEMKGHRRAAEDESAARQMDG